MNFRHLSLAPLLLLPGIAFAQSTANSTTSKDDLKVGGRIMVDSTFFDGVHNRGESGSEWELRRARLNLKHKKNDWDAELEISIDHADETVSVTDGYVRYRGWDAAQLTIGRMKEPFGLENLTSSLIISTIERSMVTEAFVPGRNYGLRLNGDSDLHSWAAGAYSVSEDEAGMDGYALTGRFTLSPINQPGRTLHFGLAGSVRDMQGEAYEVNQRAEVNTARRIIESRALVADTISQFGVEGALVLGPVSLQTEWMQQYVEETSETGADGQSVDLNGHYVLASWFLTGESRPYDRGGFDEVKPAGDRGAWELVARYSHIDLVDSGEGVKASTWLAGVNYYATARVRLMMNVARLEVDEAEAVAAETGNSLTFRIQYDF